MKRIITFALLLFVGIKSLKSQDSGISSKGNNMINVYYGVNLFTGLYKNFLSNNAIDASYKQVGPVGLVYEHLVTDGIGIGAEVGYSGYKINFRETYSDPNSNTLQTYDWEYKWSTIRAMFRANFHFSKSEKFDAYGLVSAGYRQSHFSFTTNNPYQNNINTNFTFIPFGIKPGLGFRYFFTDYIGLNLEIALGTPIICGGLAFKFY